MHFDYLTKLLKFQGFKVVDFQETRYDGKSAVTLTLDRTRPNYHCGKCGQAVQQGYDSAWQEIQHLTLWQHVTWLRFKRYRVNCPDCGVQTEALDFVGIRGPRVTHSLAALVHELCKVMTVKAVSIL